MSMLILVRNWFIYLSILISVLVGATMLNIKSAKADELSLPEMTLVAEAKNQGYIGMLAVAEVIRTRAKERHLTPDEVVLQKWQFSCWNDLQDGFRLVYDLLGYRTEKEMAEIHATARKAWLDSATTNVTKGADLYHATYVKPNWNWNKTKYITAVGKHLFYKEIK